MSAELWDELVIYLDLAMAYKNRGMISDSDRALLMAGCCASLANYPQLANYLRHQVLQRNPNHMIRRWDDFQEALSAPEFQSLIKQVSAKIPIENYEETLKSLGYRRKSSLEDFTSELNFIAHILKVDPSWLDDF